MLIDFKRGAIPALRKKGDRLSRKIRTCATDGVARRLEIGQTMPQSNISASFC